MQFSVGSSVTITGPIPATPPGEVSVGVTSAYQRPNVEDVEDEEIRLHVGTPLVPGSPLVLKPCRQWSLQSNLSFDDDDEPPIRPTLNLTKSGFDRLEGQPQRRSDGQPQNQARHFNAEDDGAKLLADIFHSSSKGRKPTRAHLDKWTKLYQRFTIQGKVVLYRMVRSMKDEGIDWQNPKDLTRWQLHVLCTLDRICLPMDEFFRLWKCMGE